MYGEFRLCLDFRMLNGFTLLCCCSIGYTEGMNRDYKLIIKMQDKIKSNRNNFENNIGWSIGKTEGTNGDYLIILAGALVNPSK